MTFEKTAEILAEYKDIDKGLIKPETTWEELSLDSLDVVDLVMTMEEKFGVTLEMGDGVKTVGDLVKLIDEAKK